MIFSYFLLQGCVPTISSCNGACPNHLNYVSRQLSNLSPMGEHLKGYNLTETTEVTQSSGRSDRRILCGNSCLTKDEARNKYHCGGLCQVEKIIHIWINRNMIYYISGEVRAMPCGWRERMSSAFLTVRRRYLH